MPIKFKAIFFKTVFLLAGVSTIYSQNNTESVKSQIIKPFVLKDYEDVSRGTYYKVSVGDYKQILIADKYAITAGDTIKIDYFITGYGNIKGAKLNVAPAIDVVSPNSLIINHLHTGINENANQLVLYSDTLNYLPDKGNMVWQLRGMIFSEKDKIYSTMFRDQDNLKLDVDKMKEANWMIQTENYHTHKNIMVSPLEFIFLIREETLPGIYRFYFTLNYFNGKEYQIDQAFVDIKIMTWFERNEDYTVIFGYLLSILTMIGLLYTGYKFIKRLLDIYNPNKKKTVKIENALSETNTFSQMNFKYFSKIFKPKCYYVIRKNFDGLLLIKDHRNRLDIIESSLISVDKNILLVDKIFICKYFGKDICESIKSIKSINVLKYKEGMKVFDYKSNVDRNLELIVVKYDDKGLTFSIGKI